MFRKSLVIAALGLAFTPAVASADAYSDGRISVREARSETRSVMKHADVRGSLFRVSITRSGSMSSIPDPAVVSTTYRVVGCMKTGRSASCAVFVSAFATGDKRKAYRSAAFNVIVEASASRRSGSATVYPAS